MKAGTVIKKENLLLISVEDEFDTSEAMFLGDIAKGILKNELDFCVKEFKPLSSILMKTNETIPLLVIGKGDNINLDVNNERVAELINRELSFSINEINLYANKEIIANEKFSLGYKFKNPILDDYKEELFNKQFTSNQSLFKAIQIGRLLIIAPNREIMYFEENEIKRAVAGDDYYWKIKKTLLKASFIKELRERQKALREYTHDFLRSFNARPKKELTVVNYDNILNSGLYIGLMDIEKSDFYKRELILPFKLSECRIIEGDKVKFVKPEVSFKTEEELEKEIKEREDYLLRKSIEEKKFEAEINLLKEKGYSWYSLNPIGIKEWDNEDCSKTWMVYLNSSDKHGWYSLEDLKDWNNGVGIYFKK